MREETCCSNMGYSFRLTPRVLLYAPSHKSRGRITGVFQLLPVVPAFTLSILDTREKAKCWPLQLTCHIILTSLDLITPLLAFRKECGVTLIAEKFRFNFKTLVNGYQLHIQLIIRVPFRNFFTDLRFPANHCSPLSIALPVDPITRNHHHVLTEVILDFLAFNDFTRLFIA